MPGINSNPCKSNVFRAPAGVDGAGISPNTSACPGEGSNQDKYRAALVRRMDRVARACLGDEADEVLRGKSHEDILIMCAGRNPQALMDELRGGNLRELFGNLREVFCLDAEQVVKVVKGFAASAQGVEIAMRNISRLGLESDAQKAEIASPFARANRDYVIRHFYDLRMEDQKLIAQTVEGLNLNGHELIQGWRSFQLSDFPSAKELLSTCFKADPGATVKLVRGMDFEKRLPFFVRRAALREALSGARSEAALDLSERVWLGLGMALGAASVVSLAFAEPGNMSSLIQDVSLICYVVSIPCILKGDTAAVALRLRGLFN